MEEKQKKLFICLLLLISCLTSALLIIYAPLNTPKQLARFEQADSLILASLNRFSISEEQVNIRSVPMDSVHNRTIYHIAVPPGFSKTQFHFELSKTFYPFNVSAPAYIIFPQQDMIIHVVYHQTVIHTLELRTDPDLAMKGQQQGNLPLSPNI